MIISEVIKQLQIIQAAHGDLPVLHHDDWCEFVVDDIEYRDGAPVQFDGGGTDDARGTPRTWS